MKGGISTLISGLYALRTEDKLEKITVTAVNVKRKILLFALG